MKHIFINKHLLSVCSVIVALFIISGCNNHTNSDSQKIDIEEITIDEIHDSYLNNIYSVQDLVAEYLQRIDELDRNGPGLNSIIVINPDVMKIAEELDNELKEGKMRGPLHGIPVLLKDNIDTHDKMPTTAGSRALKNSFPLKDSFIAKKLRESGAVILGKANLSEWANFRGEMSSSGWSGIGGQTRNPYDLRRNPCGSSSGSGVAVSANFTVLAIGTETNGSIVCPSSSNGIVGIKPTVGLLSRSGIIPISYTQDTPGPMARTLRDAVICLGALTGEDASDAKTMGNDHHILKDYTQFLVPDGLKDKRLGVYTITNGINYKVDTLFNKAIEVVKKQGAEVIYVDKLYDEEVGSLSFEIMLYEYKDGLNSYFESLGESAPVKDLSELIEFNRNDSIEMSFYNQIYLEMANEKSGLSSEEYITALEKMNLMVKEKGLDRVMDSLNLDAIIAPTGGPAWLTDHTNGDSYQLGSSSPAAISGYPNITVPMGYIDDLPVGISFFGRSWSEPKLIEIAYGFESNTKVRSAPKFLNNN